MSYLYVTEHGRVLGVEQNRLEVRYEGIEEASIPIETLDSIEIHGRSYMTASAISECLMRNIPVSFHSDDGCYTGMLSPTGKVNVHRQKLQFKQCEENAFCLEFAGQIIRSKIRNQLVILRRYARYSQENIESIIGELQKEEQSLERSVTMDEIMGCEGYAARNYFRGLGRLTDEAFRFEGRSKRPPKDEFNALLSLGYSILFHEIYAKVEKKGLNAYFGVMHADKAGHPSLVSDLMEEWRLVIVDTLVMSLVNGHEIGKSHFVTNANSGAIYLTREGKRIFIAKLESKMEQEMNYLDYIEYPVSFREAMDLQVNRFCHCLESGNPKDYHPVRIR